MESETTLHASLQETTHDLLELVRPTSRLSNTSALMLAAVTAALVCIALLTVPSLIFNQPGDDAYTQFSRILACERASLLPLTLTGLCCATALLLPFPRLSNRLHLVRAH
jgi:hypothetical protein